MFERHTEQPDVFDKLRQMLSQQYAHARSHFATETGYCSWLKDSYEIGAQLKWSY
ncbi:hypothetical protein LY10_04214 [Planktotalea frisia]|jgi:hypothetical protein|uniref:Uncharacterized protein n=1 Tax=Planktotalea frisia TaxID=696762 RepID=A0A1L9P0E9_9RHOB|nr:hypothetical protein PFRI_07810 [Planktotalea frisia]PZX18021.1 hypothetical protein LY10_04214 [Planktotalea frisia]